MNKEQFYQKIEEFDINITSLQKKQLELFFDLLIEWNQKINLTSITDEKEVYLKHYFDSLTLGYVIDLKNEKTLCDVGSGAGFPGIVLKIIFPNLDITLMDSLNKRVNYLNKVIEILKLTNIRAIHTRAEDYGRKERDKFDIVVARAVAPLNVLMEYCLPITKVGGHFIAMKGNISQEIKNIDKVTKKLDCEIDKIHQFFLPFENSERALIKFKKIKSTNQNYPRSFSAIKKEPLK